MHFLKVMVIVQLVSVLLKRMSLLQKSFSVIPAKAGIQLIQIVLDPCFRRGDGFSEFCKNLE